MHGGLKTEEEQRLWWSREALERMMEGVMDGGGVCDETKQGLLN